jgi:hypothetical protein
MDIAERFDQRTDEAAFNRAFAVPPHRHPLRHARAIFFTFLKPAVA